MTDPYSETILKALVAEIQKVSVATGYYQDLAIVQRFDSREQTLAEKPNVQVLREGEEKAINGSEWHVTLRVRVLALIAPPKAVGDLTTDELTARLQDDVERAILKAFDPQGVLQATLERYSADSVISEDDTDPHEGVTFRLTIHYKHDQLDTRLVLA